MWPSESYIAGVWLFNLVGHGGIVQAYKGKTFFETSLDNLRMVLTLFCLNSINLLNVISKYWFDRKNKTSFV